MTSKNMFGDRKTNNLTFNYYLWVIKQAVMEGWFG